MSRKQIEDQEAAQEQKEYDKLLAHVRAVLETESGRAVIWHILEQCGVYSGGFVGGEHSFFLQGQRDIGLNVIGLLLDVDSTAYSDLQMRMAKNGR